jgi:tetratricopeptide (TPR) repeat protein
MADLKKVYNDFYEKYDVDVHSDPYRFTEVSNLCHGDVLDVACGTGDLADFYKGKYVGLDISDVAVEKARDVRRADADFCVVDIMEEMKDTGVKYDTIVLCEFFEHIDNDIKVLENIKRLSKPNTRLIISVPNGDRVPDENHLREFTVPELRKKFSPLGKVKFHLWNGFTHRILMTVDMGETNEDLMSLVMMVKDEGKGLEKAILSSLEIVNNVVVSVDEDSSDETLQIATRYADTVKRHKWRNDFGWARNFAQEGVKSRWILSLDGHEFVKETGRIKDMMGDCVEGLMITVLMEGGDTFVTPRIFRSTLTWTKAIHNTISCKDTRAYEDFIIEHDRAGGQSLASTAKRMEQVKATMESALLKELKGGKSNARALFYLARYYRQFKKWKKAIKYYKKYLKIGVHKGEMWLACYEAGVLANALGKHLLALKFFKQAEELLPNRWEIAKQMGLTYCAFEQYQRGIECLTDSHKINTGKFSYNPEERDTADTWDKIGFAWFQMVEYQKAKISWQEAIKNETDPEKIKLNERRIELIDNGINF